MMAFLLLAKLNSAWKGLKTGQNSNPARKQFTSWKYGQFLWQTIMG